MNTLTIRLPDLEKQTLKRYCLKFERKQTDVVREFIRGLDAELESDRKD